ncbi:LacI family transcriptional regulator [Streptomyces sp. NEAU-H3]|nr:LacI family transcriptional regulator [Streptomyces sp. NEAU-H3]
MNIGEIARRAGVSRSTVSYVLSGKRQVSEAIRERVMRVVEESGYRPSATARALAHGSTRTFGLVIPPTSEHLVVEQLRFVGAVAEAAAAHDHDVLLSPSGEAHESAFDRMVGERRVDGVIVMETMLHDSRVARLIDEGLPFVTIGRTGAEEAHSWVDLDYAGLVTEAVTRLAALGHERIALINRPQRLLDREYGPAFRALDAFEKAVVAHDLRGTAVCAEDEEEPGAEVTRRLLGALVSPPTAIVTVNERALDGVVAALRSARVVVPRDLSLLAVTSEEHARAHEPQIGGADVPTTEMGRNAVEALLRRVTHPEEPLAHVLLSPPFLPRGTEGPAPASA